MPRTKPRRDYGKPWSGRAPRVPSPRWRTPQLMTSLANAGWGELAGRDMQGVRSTLHALVATLPWGSAAGKATCFDIATRSGLSVKWTERCLWLLEDLGVVEWTRGGIDINNARDRKGRPGWFRIVKRALVDLIMAARPLNDERTGAYRQATLERIRRIKTRYTRTRLRNQVRSPYNRRSEHVELSGDPTPQVGGPEGAPPRSDGVLAPTDPQEAPAAPAPSAADAAAAQVPAVDADMSGPGLVRAAIAEALLKSSNGSPYERARLRAQGVIRD